MITPTDWEELARASENTREVLAIVVAGLIADGFTDREARQIVVSLLAPRGEPG